MTQPKQRGRRTKLSSQVADVIIRHIHAGAFRTQAAELAGVSSSTLKLWMQRADEGVEPYASFGREVRRAAALDAIRSQSILTRAALGPIPGDWRCAARDLEKKWPLLYGRRAAAHVAVEVSREGAVGALTIYPPGEQWRDDD